MPMPSQLIFTDIHCHIVLGVDDGAARLTESLDMARTAEADDTKTLIATPHQMGTNSGVAVMPFRRVWQDLQTAVDAKGIAVSVH